MGGLGLAGFWIGWNVDFGLPALSSTARMSEADLPSMILKDSMEEREPLSPESPGTGTSETRTYSTFVVPDETLDESLPDASALSLHFAQFPDHTITSPSPNHEISVPPQMEPSEISEAGRRPEVINEIPKPATALKPEEPQPSPADSVLVANSSQLQEGQKPIRHPDLLNENSSNISHDDSTTLDVSATSEEPPISQPMPSNPPLPDRKHEANAETLASTLEGKSFLEKRPGSHPGHSETFPTPVNASESVSKEVTSVRQDTPTDTDDPSDLSRNALQRAQQLIQAGHYEEALATLSSLFQEPPTEWEPWFWMGTAYLGNGQFPEADQYFLSGLARNDKIPQLWIQRALVAQQQGDYQLSIHELRQAESLQSDLPHIQLNMGYAYDQLGNNRLATQYYGKFMQLTEGNPDFFATRKKLLARLTQSIPSNNSPIR